MGVDYYACEQCHEIYSDCSDDIRCLEQCCARMFCIYCLPRDEREKYQFESEDYFECNICKSNKDKQNKHTGLKKDLLKSIKDNKLNKQSIQMMQQYLNELVEKY